MNDRELGKNFPAEAAVQGDPCSCVEDLLNAVDVMITISNREVQTRREQLEATIGEARARFAERACATGEDGPLSAGFVARSLREMAASDAMRYQANVVFVIFNNSSYQVLKGGLIALEGESARRGPFIGMDITEPEVDFSRLAESFGVRARRVSRAAELRPALDRAFAENGPTLLNVSIARELRSMLR